MGHRTTGATIRGAAFAVAFILLGTSPLWAQWLVPLGPDGEFEDTLKISYFDVATSAAPSRSGYGGPGVSGGAGDNTVRIVNPISNAEYLTTSGASGGANDIIPMCAMIYVFDDFEEMQTCCGCPVSADGMRTLSVVNDLTSDFGVNQANLNAGVIEIVSAFPNFKFINPPPPNPPGTNDFCSPTGTFSNDPFNRALPIEPVPALRAWITHDEVSEPVFPIGKVVQSASVEEFQDAPLDPAHLENLEQRCEFLIQNGSGSGVCTCGAGENPGFFITTGSTKSR